MGIDPLGNGLDGINKIPMLHPNHTIPTSEILNKQTIQIIHDDAGIDKKLHPNQSPILPIMHQRTYLRIPILTVQIHIHTYIHITITILPNTVISCAIVMWGCVFVAGVGICCVDLVDLVNVYCVELACR